MEATSKKKKGEKWSTIAWLEEAGRENPFSRLIDVAGEVNRPSVPPNATTPHYVREREGPREITVTLNDFIVEKEKEDYFQLDSLATLQSTAMLEFTEQ